MSDESERVKKHNRNKMRQGYKNISFKVSPEEFKMIKQSRKQHKMSTRELLIYFVSSQYEKDVFEGFYESTPTLSIDQYHQKQNTEFGRSHKFLGKKEYVLIRYLTVDRQKTKVIKDFDSYDEALQYYKNNDFNKRMALYGKDEYSEEDWYQSLKEW